MKYKELEIGLAGEHLVCAYLLARGMRAFRAEQNCPYDVALESHGRLIRIQVRTTQNAKPYLQERQRHITGYTWWLSTGKGARKGFSPNSFDVIALVALDTRQIAYLSAIGLKRIVQIPVSGAKSSRGKTFAALTLERVLEAM